MKCFLIPSIACVLAACSFVSAASTVAYNLELGGDPHRASYKLGFAPEYTRGSGSNVTTPVSPGTPINWDVTVTVTGTHSGGIGDGSVPAGVANAVFTLELKDSAGSTVQLGHVTYTHPYPPWMAGWYSIINDGTARTGYPADPVQSAAYTIAFNIGGNGNLGGRLFDRDLNGGPYVDYYHYPSCTGLPANATNCAGKLIGMGAGYSSFVPTAGGGPNTGGVGLTFGYCPGLGEKALFEGQISTVGLAGGTYTLSVTGGSGTNVLPYLADGSTCDPGPAGAFAVAPNNIAGDSVSFVIGCCGPGLQVIPANQNVAYTAGSTTFTVNNITGGSFSYTSATGDSWLHIGVGGSGSCPPNQTLNVSVDANPNNSPQRIGTITVTAPGATGSPQTVTVAQVPCCCGLPLQVVSSVSRKTHGTSGTFNVPSGSWEGRVPTSATQGPSKIVTVFNQGIATPVVAGNLSVSSGTIGTITVSTTTVANDTLTVNLTTITNKATFTIGYPGVAAACDAGNTTAATNCWVVLAGEASGPGGGSTITVNTSDYVSVRGRIGQVLTTSNFRYDVNASGAIDTSDYVSIRGRIDPSTTLTATCP